MPTSLTYIVPTCQRLFTLETCCGYGYGPARDLHPLPRIFKGQRELTGRRRNRDAFQGTGPSLGANPFQGALPFTKKRELSPGLPPASPGSVALPHWTPRGTHLRHSGFGDLNPTPFGTALAHLSGPTDPCSTAVHMEPFSSFSPQGSHLSICYYHQDLHQRRLQAGSRPAPSTLAAATLLLTAT